MKASDAPAARETIATILKLVKTEKIKGKYGEIEPWEDGAVHSFQNPAGTETTRFSHSTTWLFEPGSANLATLPKKAALGEPLFNVREAIIPHPGRTMLAVDYSQAEARWAAWMAADPVRIKIYEEGIDHYKFFVALLKWEDESRWEEVTKAERNSIGKVGTLSGQYKVGWKTLQTSVNDDFDLHGVTINAKTAKAMEALWPQMFPKTVEWWEEVEDAVRTDGFTINPLGRKRIYFGRMDTPAAVQAVVREAIADGPQSANAMALNAALQRLHTKHDPHLLRVLQNVHDEILLDCAPKDLMRVARVVKEEMEVPFEVRGRTLVIPAEVNATSTNWADMKEVHV